MADIPLQSIIALVDYLHFDERRDYADRPADDRACHIFNHVKVVAEWLEAHGLPYSDMTAPAGCRHPKE
jgi:hypothetical protein